VFDRYADWDHPRMADEFQRIDAYCDTVPRAAAATEQIGAFTLFVGRPGRSFYARPTAGSATTRSIPPERDDFYRVLARQRILRQPQAFEWIHEIHPALAEAARSAGLGVQLLPLMVLRRESTAGVPPGYSVRIQPADNPALPAALAAIGLSFGTPGTAVGAVGSAERDAAAATAGEWHESVRADIRDGLTVVAAAEDATGPVSGGSHSPRGTVTEITGVGTLPAQRRRGLGAAVTHALTADAAGRGVDLCFLTARSSEVARVYCRGRVRRDRHLLHRRTR
jgi:hypothetical protein